MAVGAAHPALHAPDLMGQVKLVLDGVSGQSFGQTASLQLGRGQAFPDPFAVQDRVAHAAAVRDAKRGPSLVSISYSVAVVVAARADPIGYERRVYARAAVFGVAIDAAHPLSLMLIINDRANGIGGVARRPVLLDRTCGGLTTGTRNSIAIQL